MSTMVGRVSTPEQTPSLAAENDDLADALVQSAFVTMAVLTRVAAENDLSLTQLRVFGILRDRRAGITALAEYLGLDKSTLTGLVRRAEARGLLRREPNPKDGRAVDVVMTAQAAELATKVRGDIDASLAPMVRTLNATDQRRLQLLLQRTLVEPGVRSRAR